MWLWNEARLQNFEQFFAFKFIVIELPCAFLSFGSLYLGILGFKSDLHAGLLQI